MMSRRLRFVVFLALFSGLTLVSFPAFAYIGPAIAFIAYLLGPVVAVVAGIAMILSFPILKLYRKFKGKDKKVPSEDKIDPS